MIWLIGNKGMLGSDVEQGLSQYNKLYIATDQEVDITNMSCIELFLSENHINEIKYIINCAAYTAVDKAESEKDKAFKLNAEGPWNLAKVAKKTGATLVHISTDYVFDGTKKDSYKEDDPTNPLSIYGKSKLKGERYVQKEIDHYFILRTAWLYGKNGKNFVKTIIKLLKERDELKIVNDQKGNPTYTKDLAEVIISIINRNIENYNIYHVTNEGQTTWYGFAKEIYRYGKENGIINRKPTLLSISGREYKTPAQRPNNSCLNKKRLKKHLGITMRLWSKALYEYLGHENW